MTASKTLIHDILATDGRAIRRGYLELTLDEYHGADASGVDESGKPFDTIQVYLIDKSARQEVAIDTRVFATRIPSDITNDNRRKIAVALMDALTDRFKVNSFTSTFADYEQELTEFKDYCSLAEPAWFLN